MKIIQMNNITLDTGKLKISELQERATENYTK